MVRNGLPEGDLAHRVYSRMREYTTHLAHMGRAGKPAEEQSFVAIIEHCGEVFRVTVFGDDESECKDRLSSSLLNSAKLVSWNKGEPFRC